MSKSTKSQLPVVIAEQGIKPKKVMLSSMLNAIGNAAASMTAPQQSIACAVIANNTRIAAIETENNLAIVVDVLRHRVRSGASSPAELLRVLVPIHSVIMAKQYGKLVDLIDTAPAATTPEPQPVTEAPDRHQILMAMATAVYDQQMGEYEAAQKASADANKKMEELCFKMAKARMREKSVKNVDRMCVNACGDSVNFSISFSFNIDDHPEFKTLVEKTNRDKRKPQFDCILRRIKEANPQGYNAVKAMLDVPELRKALLESGIKLMASPSDKDRKSSIEVGK